MGLLDSLFNQSSYGGQGGGLLDFLRQSQMQQEQYQPSAGFPGQASSMNIGGYQMPRIGEQAQFMPQEDPAALPPNAQPAQGQMPMQAPQPPQESPGGLGAGLSGFVNNLHTGPLGAIVGGLGSAAGMQSPAQKQANQTAQFLVSKGFDPALAKTVVSDPALLRSVLPQVMGVGGQTDDIKEYQFAKKEDPSLTFNKFMQQKKAVSGEYSLTPQYGTNAKGETVMVQTGKSGEAIETKLPAGVKISSGVEKIDLGTSWGLLDKRTGAMVGTQPKDVAGKESAEKVGQAQGTAKAALANGADIDAEATKKKIDEFVSSKGFNEVFGQLDQYRPSWTHSNEGTDALARYKQLKGTAFLSAYSMLKGGGAITDVEGQKAGDAMARLDRAQGEEEAKAALRDFREAVDVGLQKLKRAANGGAEPASSPAAAPKRIRLNADGTIAQ
jgi:hypothetical protein